MKKEITVGVDKVKRRKKLTKIAKLVILILFLLLILLYFIMGIIYNNGNFSITLDKNLYFERNIIMYDDPTYKVYREELQAPAVDYFDNISYKWLPDNLDQIDGSHRLPPISPPAAPVITSSTMRRIYSAIFFQFVLMFAVLK